MTPTRKKTMTQMFGAAALLIMATLLGGAVIGYLSGSDPDFDSGGGAVWLIGGIASVLMIGALAFGAVWIRSIDEAAREAHKAAWYWGGSGGMALGGVVIVLATLTGAERWAVPSLLEGRTDPAAYAATGAFGILLLMLAGHTVVWAWWWLARR